ncbi:hypothetical protein CCR79_12720 [Halorhodospira halophila]|nr:hypothetical protein [Halorhodospira halophila]
MVVKRWPDLLLLFDALGQVLGDCPKRIFGGNASDRLDPLFDDLLILFVREEMGKVGGEGLEVARDGVQTDQGVGAL